MNVKIHYPNNWALRPMHTSDEGSFFVFILPVRNRAVLALEKKEEGKRKSFDIPIQYIEEELSFSDHFFHIELPRLFTGNKVTNEGIRLKLYKEELALLLHWQKYQKDIELLRKNLVTNVINEAQSRSSHQETAAA